LEAKDVLAALLAELLKVEDLAAMTWLRLHASAGAGLDAAALAKALGDAERAEALLRQLLARLPAQGGPEAGDGDDWPA
jgi:hypothetical protein